jgi:glycosyltransferase involved in cell wall biosynthesis
VNRRLRVGLDGRAIVSPAGGVRRYVRELVAALRQLDAPLDLVALGGPDAWPSGVEHRPEPAHLPTNLGWTAVGLWRAARAARLDVYHAPAYTAPPAGVHPIVLTIHDVSYERHPEWYPHRRDPLRRWFYRASARAASIVLTDSVFSQREIAAAYGLPLDRIRVVPLGVSSQFAPAPVTSVDAPGRLTDARSGQAPAHQSAAPVHSRTAPHLSHPSHPSHPFLYVLHVGDLHPRRNLDVALEAVINLRTTVSALSDLTLVLVGTDRGEASRLTERAVRVGHPAAVRIEGPVDDEALVAWYRGAAALVYPSLYEGFGLPMLEAMAIGTPVIAADASTSGEVTGEAAVLVPPSDTSAWIEAIRDVLQDAERRSDLRRRGVARAAQFTWERTARATWDAYRDAAAEAGRA